MSSCLGGGGGGRTYGFDLEIVKSPCPSTRSSSPSSTLSEASNSPRTLSTKRARTPRKRPNQAYTEAAALLSTVYPKVFPAKIPGRMCRHRRSHDSFADPSELLPSFPAIGDAAFLIRDTPIEAPSSFSFHLEPKPANFTDHRSPTNGFQQPGSPGPLEEDFDAKSILDEETGEGIDSIMGNLSMDSIVFRSTHHANPQFRSLMGLGLGGRFELGFGLRCNLRRALRNTDNGDWWRSSTVAMLDIVPKFQALPPPSQSEKKTKKKKKKTTTKKVEKEEVKELPSTDSTNANTITSIEELRSSLLLKLNHEEVLKEWSDRGSPYAVTASSNASSSPESTADILARLSEIDLFPEGASGGAGGIREASVMRYKEKRRSRLFSKKIRYQVRKVNADRRPRMKASGRFVKRPSSSLLKEAIEQENL